MADEDARRGIRALISGGMHSMDDEAIDRLQEVAAQTQRTRGRTPNLAEIEYLQAYSQICERRLNLEISLWKANQDLSELNDRFSALGKSGILREQIAGPEELVNAEDGWMSSSYSC